jgi:type IV pilus assembly protein PilW
MNPRVRSASPCARQRGVGLVETMVGILIGMIVILVVFNILSVAEGYRRTTVGASDAQITGLLSEFVAGRDAANGGAGITMSNSDMIKCKKTTGNVDATKEASVPATSLQAGVRPIPVLIIPDVAPGPGTSESFISYSAGAAHVMWPVDFVVAAAAGAPMTVQSPNGFTVPPPTAATPYWVVAMDGGVNCELVRVVNAVPDVTIPLTGKVTLTPDPSATTTFAYGVANPSRLLNLGPQGLATRIRYDVVNDVLNTTDLLVAPPAVPTRVPVAQNVVLMKAQYGIDNTGDGVVDCWTPPDNTVCGDFSPDAVRGFLTQAQFNQIVAVRIGVVVRSDEPDLRLLTDPGNLQLQSESTALLSATRPPVILFNCSANTNAACQSRVVVPMGGTPTGLPTCAPAIICDYWRYRTYETIVPLRNAIYAASMPP